jgi:hypothetical protein
MIVVGTTVYLFVVGCCSKNGAIELVTTLVAIFPVVSAAIGSVVGVNIMRIVVI